MNENPKRPTRVIAVGNQKGGVGKTATAIHLAAALGERGRTSLIWDLDSNTGLTNAFQIPEAIYEGSYEVLLGIKGEDEEFLRSSRLRRRPGRRGDRPSKGRPCASGET